MGGYITNLNKIFLQIQNKSSSLNKLNRNHPGLLLIKVAELLINNQILSRLYYPYSLSILLNPLISVSQASISGFLILVDFWQCFIIIMTFFFAK